MHGVNFYPISESNLLMKNNELSTVMGTAPPSLPTSLHSDPLAQGYYLKVSSTKPILKRISLKDGKE
jgi:hypothetical protein